MFLKIFSIIFPIFAVVALSWIYARRHQPDMQIPNQLNMAIFIPALLFSILVEKPIDWAEYGLLLLGGLGIILGSGLVAWAVASSLGLSRQTLIPPMMFSNTGNMGIPLAVFAFGEQGLTAAALLFILQTGLQFSLGLVLLSGRLLWGELLRMPMLVATFAGIGLQILAWHPPALVLEPLKLLGQVAVPLMLVALGARLNELDWNAWRIGGLGALLCPLSGVAAYALLVPWLDLDALQAAQLWLFAVLPPAVMNFLLAERFRQQPEQVAALVLFGNLFSFISIPLALLWVPPELLLH